MATHERFGEICDGPDCLCPAPGVEHFCSEYCRNVAFHVLPQRVPCPCGHADCQERHAQAEAEAQP